jgi:hypothetical protein
MDDLNKTITVEELILLLKKQPVDARIYIRSLETVIYSNETMGQEISLKGLNETAVFMSSNNELLFATDLCKEKNTKTPKERNLNA